MLTRLRLHRIRCFGTLEIPLAPGRPTVFTGANAQGKTTLLEAVCLLLRLQSPRAATLAEVVAFGAPAGAIEGDHGGRRLQFVLGEGKRMVVDGRPLGRARDYLAESGLVVWFGNDDSRLVRGGSEGRRRFLDFAASQLQPGYLDHLRQYERALRARNHLLKQSTPDPRQLAAYAALLDRHGNPVAAARRDLVARLAPAAARLQERIGGGGESLELAYRDGAPGGVAAALAARANDERQRRVTLAGPHRDDLELTLDGRPAGAFGSEGQQRTLALALKLAQAHVLHEARGEWPLLLLDDIFGELDPARRQRLWAALPPPAQTLITTTTLDWLDRDAPAAACRILRVAGGTCSDA
jgi:DNA replication and repair protein RecF